ncbi:oligosaccharide flippase family protein [Peribacillus sp. SCS-155]|uniref:oligosaccharide flippase family protein n=1 Tax=Peribacillus sedimenti TaxID=3115297 RepID=UPI003906661A
MRNQRKFGVILSYVAMLINIMIGICYTPIIIRLLGKSEFGLFSLATSVITFLAILDFGFGNALVRFNAKYIAINDKTGESKIHGFFFLLYLLIGIVSVIVGYHISNNVDLLFSNTFRVTELNKLKIILLIMTVNVALSFPLSIYSSILTAYERFAFLKIAGIISTILTNSVILVSLYFSYQSVAMAFISAIFSIGTKFFIMLYCYSKIRVRFSFTNYDPLVIKEILIYSFFIFVEIIVDQLYTNTDKIIIGAVIGPNEVAIYTIAMMFLTYFIQFSTAINSVFLPKITRMTTLDQNMNALSDLFIRVGRLQFIVLIFILSGFILYGKDFIMFWAGESYAGAYYMALIVMIPRIISLSQNLGIVILQAQNKLKFRVIIYLIIAIFNVAISIPLAKEYGGVGAAIGTLIATILGQILTMNWYYYKKVKLNIPLYWKEILSITAVAIPILTIGYILNIIIPSDKISLLAVKIGLFSIIFLLIGFKYIFNQYEKNLLLSVFDKFKKMVEVRI